MRQILLLSDFRRENKRTASQQRERRFHAVYCLRLIEMTIFVSLAIRSKAEITHRLVRNYRFKSIVYQWFQAYFRRVYAKLLIVNI